MLTLVQLLCWHGAASLFSSPKVNLMVLYKFQLVRVAITMLYAWLYISFSISSLVLFTMRYSVSFVDTFSYAVHVSIRLSKGLPYIRSQETFSCFVISVTNVFSHKVVVSVAGVLECFLADLLQKGVAGNACVRSVYFSWQHCTCCIFSPSVSDCHCSL